MRETLPRRAAVPSVTMATMAECRSALEKLSDNLARADGDVRSAAALDRSLSCHIKDLDITFTGRLTNGRIQVLDTADGPPGEKAEIRLAMTGDDLVAMVNGEMNFARAWGAGRVRLEAGFRDLLRLRSLL
ncbi:SCP-2 sterol transfer family protein [Streptomyces sp. Ncost-T10-10d]|nr:SCP-2 sterol transfer family protein [Streptomyces sp. Ncost-T10-10d]